MGTEVPRAGIFTYKDHVTLDSMAARITQHSSLYIPLSGTLSLGERASASRAMGAIMQCHLSSNTLYSPALLDMFMTISPYDIICVFVYCLDLPLFLVGKNSIYLI